MHALRGVANVMVAGLFAIEALYEGRAVQSLAPGAPTDASRDARRAMLTRPGPVAAR